MMDRDPRPSPVSAKRATTSFSRQFFWLMEYSLSPLRYTRRWRQTSSKSTGRQWSVLSNTRDTSAIPMGRRPLLPAKITSSIFVPRRYFTLCSPRTQRMASEILLLPLPLGPTMAVMPGSNSIFTLSAKDLNPWAEKLFKRTAFPSQARRSDRDTSSFPSISASATSTVSLLLVGTFFPT